MRNEYGVWTGPVNVYRSSDSMQCYAEIATAETETGWQVAYDFRTGTSGSSCPIRACDPVFPDEPAAIGHARRFLLGEMERVLATPDASRYGAGDRKGAKQIVAWLGFVEDSPQSSLFG